MNENVDLATPSRKKKVAGHATFSLALRCMTCNYPPSNNAMEQAMAATLSTSYDRSAITRAAWKLWKLAADVVARSAFDGVAIEKAAREAGASYQGAIDARNAEWLERRSVADIHSFGDAMRAAWASARQSVEFARAETARRPAAPLTGFAARRLAAECCDSNARRQEELDQIAREERAAKAA